MSNGERHFVSEPMHIMGVEEVSSCNKIYLRSMRSEPVRRTISSEIMIETFFPLLLQTVCASVCVFV